jgi:hypothetical protein
MTERNAKKATEIIECHFSIKLKRLKSYSILKITLTIKKNWK